MVRALVAGHWKKDGKHCCGDSKQLAALKAAAGYNGGSVSDVGVGTTARMHWRHTEKTAG